MSEKSDEMLAQRREVVNGFWRMAAMEQTWWRNG
jgi:hypothetical protein